MYIIIYAALAVLQAVLAVIAIRLFIKRPSLSAFALILPIAAVVWDNAIIALGASIGEGSLLVALSWPRFIGHAVFTPVWIITAIGFARRAGATSLSRPVVSVGRWVLYAACVVLGLLRSVVYLVMTATAENGLLYYSNTGAFGPPLGSIIMLFVVLIFAVVFWRHSKSPWMLLGALFMLVVAIPPVQQFIGPVLTNSGELVMAASLVLTEHVLQRREQQQAA